MRSEIEIVIANLDAALDEPVTITEAIRLTLQIEIVIANLEVKLVSGMIAEAIAAVAAEIGEAS